ncbi:MAG: Wzt carbohydrate-binding domain-containing protein, partial [Terracidiphilus sp.]
TLELEGFPAKLVPADADLTLLMTVRGNQAVDNFCFNLTIYATDGTPVGSCSGSRVHSIQAGEIEKYRLQVPNPRLAPGCYWIDLGIATGNERTGFRQFDVVADVLHFEVLPPPGQNGTVSEWQQSWGMVRFRELLTARCERE